jgi:hypothetical protein
MNKNYLAHTALPSHLFSIINTLLSFYYFQGKGDTFSGKALFNNAFDKLTSSILLGVLSNLGLSK